MKTSEQLPAALREALEEPTVIAGIPMTLDHATQEYGRRCMAAALRWAQTAGHDYTTGEASVTDAIAALEQEAT